PVSLSFLWGIRMERPPSYLSAIPREHRASVVALGFGDLHFPRAVQVHGPEIQIARCHRGVDDFLVLPIDGGLGIIARRIGEFLFDLACVIREVNVESGVDGPNVSFAAIRAGRARRPRLM